MDALRSVSPGEWRATASPTATVRESFEVVTPDHLGAGTDEIVLGVWDPQTGHRLRVSETTLAHKKDRVVVGSVTVGRQP